MSHTKEFEEYRTYFFELIYKDVQLYNTKLCCSCEHGNCFCAQLADTITHEAFRLANKPVDKPL